MLNWSLVQLYRLQSASATVCVCWEKHFNTSELVPAGRFGWDEEGVLLQKSVIVTKGHRDKEAEGLVKLSKAVSKRKCSYFS